MNLVIDYGNTTVKVGIFDQHVLKEKFTFAAPRQFQEYLATIQVKNCIISSVSIEPSDIASWVTANNKFVLLPSLPVPVHNHYQTPQTLGVDRLAGVCGAVQLFPGENTLVIDAGTCITYDFIDQNKNYLGGAIAPGLTMRFKALHTFTSRLPLINQTADAPLIGNSTETSIQSGVMNGLLAETEGIINRYREKYRDLRVILCGGDAHFFENKLKASIFASPDLVLIGLNSILIYNVEK